MLVTVPQEFTPMQRVCIDYIERCIRQVSEEFYAAGWMIEIDLELYSNMINQKPSYLEPETMENLKFCSEAVNGWVSWDDEISSPAFKTHDQIKKQIEDIMKLRKERLDAL
jgi:hypothetical protein